MDILTHTLSGILVGTILVNFTQNGFLEKIFIVFFSALGGALPDIDAISLWSKFDSTFGKFFGLTHRGQEIYFSKFWYSHHAFFHSLFAGILFAFLILVGLYLLRLLFETDKSFWSYIMEHILIGVAFLGGYVMHLLGDLPTPACTWGGINLFWPLHSYVGGSGKIWWWNNYDIFLLISGAILANTLIYITGGYFKIKKIILTPMVGLFCLSLVLVQINTRPQSFNNKVHADNYGELEQRSKQNQEKILGDMTYRWMEMLDNRLPINF